MTVTKQPVTWGVIQEREKPKKAEPLPEADTCDMLAVCDSLFILSEKLDRLAYVLQRKNIEASLSEKEYK